MPAENDAAMLKKLLLVTAIAIGLLYGSGNDLDTLKQHIKGSANDNARTLTAGDNGGWSPDSGY